MIVVDNGSTDGSAHLIDEFPNVQFIRLPKNFGLTKALNLGWRAADAEYVIFLHDDTRVQPATIAHSGRRARQPRRCRRRLSPAGGLQGNPAPQLGTLPPTGEWRPAATRRRPSPWNTRAAPPSCSARLFHQSHPPDRRALRPVRQRRRSGRRDPARLTARSSWCPPQWCATRDAAPTPRRDAPISFNARAVFLGKYYGFAAGLKARMAAVLGPLFGFRFGELSTRSTAKRSTAPRSNHRLAAATALRYGPQVYLLISSV